MTDKELRILDEMLTNLEIWSTWNKTFANEMMGICSKMRNLLADRKTEPKDEPQTDAEIPKNALRSDCTGCRFVGWYDTDFPCVNCVRKNKDYYDSEYTEGSK
jgi:hypothetical protein